MSDFEFRLPLHTRDQVQAGLRESSDSEIAAVVGCLRGMAESFEKLSNPLAPSDVALVLRTLADQFTDIRPGADT